MVFARIFSLLIITAPVAYSLVLQDDVVSPEFGPEIASYCADIEVKGRLPALGWNSWNAYHCDVSEDKILAAANQIVDLGLKDAGYEYVNSMDMIFKIDLGLTICS